MKTTDWDHYFPHFAPEEYLSPGGIHLFKNKNIVPFDPVIMLNVESMRFNLNYAREEGFILSDKEITLLINHDGLKLRGFVTPEEWKRRDKEEGQTYSFHLWCAADISSPEVSPYTLFHHAKLHMSFMGIIQYDWGIHVDMRRGDQYIKEKGFKPQG
jgi:hypothetical protein